MSLDIELYTDRGEILFEANITHNLAKMAEAGGFYKALWRADEELTTPQQLGAAIRRGLHSFVDHPATFRAFEPANGWGTFDDFVVWLLRLVEACDEYPDAVVEVYR